MHVPAIWALFKGKTRLSHAGKKTHSHINRFELNFFIASYF